MTSADTSTLPVNLGSEIQNFTFIKSCHFHCKVQNVRIAFRPHCTFVSAARDGPG
jgi:hypothetical protein